MSLNTYYNNYYINNKIENLKIACHRKINEVTLLFINKWKLKIGCSHKACLIRECSMKISLADLNRVYEADTPALLSDADRRRETPFRSPDLPEQPTSL